MDLEWRDLFTQKSIHEIREIVYDTRAKATAKRSELRQVVRHSHRELLKTANTVVEMRGLLEEVEVQAKQLMVYDSEVIDIPPKNAERFARNLDGKDLKDASAMGFVKACLDVVQSQGSLILGAKAILAARLALNTLPRNSQPYFQTLRDRFSRSRSVLLKQIDLSLLSLQPLEALQAYAFITGSSSSEVLQHFLTTRLSSIQSSLNITSPDNRTILQIMKSIKSTIADVNALFPFLYQRTTNELKSTSLLSHNDLQSNLQRRRGNIELWIEPDIRKFLIWTKGDILDNTGVDALLDTWMGDISTLLEKSAEGLFTGMQDLDMLCSLRGEIISSLIPEDEDVSPFEEKCCGILVKATAAQITRIMETRVKKIHELEAMARELIANVKVEDIGLSIWEPIKAKQPKLDQILSLKTAQERPNYKTLATRYSLIIREIHVGEIKLSSLAETSQEARFGEDGISSLLTIHKKTLSNESESLSKRFETILEEVVREIEQTDDLSACKVICWLRIHGIILNPPRSIPLPFANFASSALQTGQRFLAKYISSKVTLCTKDLLSKQSWTGPIPEQSLWEGDPRTPVRPTRIPIQILKEITSRLNTLGVDLLRRDFVMETMQCCREGVVASFEEIPTEEMSADAAMQLIADIVFVEIALGAKGVEELSNARKILIEKAGVEGMVEKISGPLKTYWKRTSLLFGILHVEEMGAVDKSH